MGNSYKGDYRMVDMNFMMKDIAGLQKRFNDAIKSQEKLLNNVELMNKLKEVYSIQNSDTFKKAFDVSNLLNSSLPNISVEQYLKRIDVITSIKNNSNLLSMDLTYSKLINNVLQNVDENIVEKIEETEEIEEEHYESEKMVKEDNDELKIKRPALFNIAFNINYVINVTDNEIVIGNVGEEDKRNWKNIARPILSILFQIFLAWAFGTAPLTDTSIYQGIETIIEQISQMDFVDDED